MWGSPTKYMIPICNKKLSCNWIAFPYFDLRNIFFAGIRIPFNNNSQKHDMYLNCKIVDLSNIMITKKMLCSLITKKVQLVDSLLRSAV